MPRPKRSLPERVAMELRQMEAEDAAAVHGSKYPYTAQETWDRAQEVLREGYRRDARRLLRVIRAHERVDQ